MSDRIGFIGLGSMGGLMARHLLDWPGGLVVHDVRPEAMEPFVGDGATATASTAEVGAACDVICVMVLDDAQTTDVVDQLLPHMDAGQVIAIHSTIRPGTAERLAARGAEQGVHVVDAPVSGSTAGSTAGTLAVLFGGPDEAYERCKEPFACFATLVSRFGPAGAGTRAKLARNLVTFAAFTAAGEAQRVADAAGIDLRKLGRVVKHSDAVTGGASSVFVREHAVPYPEDDFMRPYMEHARALGRKDLELVMELAADLGVETPMAALAHERLAEELGVPD